MPSNQCLCVDKTDCACSFRQYIQQRQKEIDDGVAEYNRQASILYWKGTEEVPNNCACNSLECLYCHPKAGQGKCALPSEPKVTQGHGKHCGTLLQTCMDPRGHYGHSSAEPPPKQPSLENPFIWDLVVKDMVDRDASGYRKYGVRLQPHNGRKTLTDAYQEALDLAVYLRQAIYERDGK